MQPLKFFFFLAILFLFTSNSNASLLGINILSETHRVQGSAGYEDNVSYDFTDEEQISFSANGSSSFFGPDHSEAAAGDLDIYTEAVGAFSWSAVESTYTFNINTTNLTLHMWGYSLSSGIPSEALSSVMLTDLNLNQQILSIDNIYQPVSGEPVGAGSFYSFDDIYELTLNTDHTFELVLSALSNTGQGGIYESLLHADINSIAAPEPTSILLVAAGLAGAGISRRKKNAISVI